MAAVSIGMGFKVEPMVDNGKHWIESNTDSGYISLYRVMGNDLLSLSDIDVYLINV